MTGNRLSAEDLNKNLELIVGKFTSYQVSNWFVAYGTLLGLVRDGSCIHGDDDIDIVVDLKEIDKVNSIIEELVKNDLYEHVWSAPKRFTQIMSENSQLDIYYADVDSDGNFFDRHEKITWTNCLNPHKQIPTILWNGIEINVPNDRIQKLERRYGTQWTKRIKKTDPGGEGYRNVKKL